MTSRRIHWPRLIAVAATVALWIGLITFCQGLALTARAIPPGPFMTGG